MQQQHASQLADLQQQLQLLEALAQPDPCPKPWQLNLRAEASKYFLTELDTDPTAQGSGDAAAGLSAGPPKPKLFATGLGLGPEVPKFLRWDQPVQVHDIGLQELEQQVRQMCICMGNNSGLRLEEVYHSGGSSTGHLDMWYTTIVMLLCFCMQVCQLWQAKAAYEAAHGQCCLQTFLYEHYRTQALRAAAAADSAQATAAGTPAAAAAAVASSEVPLSQSGAAVSTEQPAAQPAEAGSGSAQSALAPAAAAAGAADGTGAPSTSGNSSSGSSSCSGGAGSNSGASAQQANTPPAPVVGCSCQPNTAMTAAAAAEGYQLYYSCCTHRHDSVAVELLWLVLTGQLPEAMLEEQRQQLQAVAHVLQKLHAKAAGTGAAQSAGTAAEPASSAEKPESATDMAELTGQPESSSSSSSSVGQAPATGVPWSHIISTMQVWEAGPCAK